eukprot:scaffold90683_cov84-Phaeocystis_antarctica.AAC.2
MLDASCCSSAQQLVALLLELPRASTTREIIWRMQPGAQHVAAAGQMPLVGRFRCGDKSARSGRDPPFRAAPRAALECASYAAAAPAAVAQPETRRAVRARTGMG